MTPTLLPRGKHESANCASRSRRHLPRAKHESALCYSHQFLFSFTTTTMNTQNAKKRKRGNRLRLVEGDIELANAVMPETVTETREDGSTFTKRIMVSLDEAKPKENKSIAGNNKGKGREMHDMGYEPVPEYEPDNNQNSPPPKTYRVSISIELLSLLIHRFLQRQKDYVQQYVDRMEGLMEALISREGMPGGASKCCQCDKAEFAVWRCRECLLGAPLCRGCMRQTHRNNPLHRIEHWNGGYFRTAELWEVGTYLLVKHHKGEGVCDSLRNWCGYLEKAEETKDAAEQKELRQSKESNVSVPEQVPVPDVNYFADDDDDDEKEGNGTVDSDEDVDDDEEIEETEEPGDLNPYLGGKDTSGTGTGSIGSAPGFAIPGSYIRVVHTNGLHDIAMVSCHCQGDEELPLDLFAAQLLPASFKRIRTLFTAQVLDKFRLSNLELKASAYQFYQLLRRLTRPMAPSEVPDLYREFRRMSRIWRWMKKLKWAGYSGTNKKVQEVGRGDLAIFCPACPQPGINLPENWKEDSARQVK